MSVEQKMMKINSEETTRLESASDTAGLAPQETVDTQSDVEVDDVNGDDDDEVQMIEIDGATYMYQEISDTLYVDGCLIEW